MKKLSLHLPEEMKGRTTRVMNLLDLPIYDVIVRHIIPYLTPADYLNLRVVSKQTHALVTEYFRVMKYLDFTSHETFPKAFLEVNKINKFPFHPNFIRFHQIIGKNSHHLKFLKLSGCQWCTDDFVKDIFSNNSNLRYVDLSNCTNLKNGSLQPLAINCKVL